MGHYGRYYKILGYLVADYRKKGHLPLEGLAMKAIVSRTHISHIGAEGVHEVPSLDILFRICTILRIEPYQLFQVREQDGE